MNPTRLVLLNSAVLTDYGNYRYSPLTVSKAKALMDEFRATPHHVYSAIGHQATAEFLSRLLAFPVAYHRVAYQQRSGDLVVLFKLRGRVAEGAILTGGEMETMGYDFGLLRRFD